MWKTVHGSVAGTSHETAGTPCQDACRVRQLQFGEDYALVVACSDGAGSAKHSEHGSALICEQFVAIATEKLSAGHRLADFSRETALEWCARIRDVMKQLANELNCEFRDLAATLLGVVLSPECACFIQIGDGAIVAQYSGLYDVVFWPQSGEYLNVTNFLTDDDFDTKLDFSRLPASDVSGVAVFTDGLERLVLQYSERTVHIPFLEPLFESLASRDAESLMEPMRTFLSSQSINERTDDDKTLILALRAVDTGNGNAAD